MTSSPWVLVVVLAAAGAGSLLHAKKLKADDDASGTLVWPWVVAGVVLLGMAAGIGVADIAPFRGTDATGAE
jgi:hypothetical protein